MHHEMAHAQTQRRDEGYSNYMGSHGESIVSGTKNLYDGINPLSDASAEQRAASALFGIDLIVGAKLGSYKPKIQTVKSLLDDLPINIHKGQQGKHIVGHNNYRVDKSFINEGIDPQELLNGVHSGQYKIITKDGRGNPIIDFRKPIGIDAKSGRITSKGKVHSSGVGAHIVPTLGGK